MVTQQQLYCCARAPLLNEYCIILGKMHANNSLKCFQDGTFFIK
jgi:hypothetical protein